VTYSNRRQHQLNVYLNLLVKVAKNVNRFARLVLSIILVEITARSVVLVTTVVQAYS
jgi:hypothetical protein